MDRSRIGNEDKDISMTLPKFTMNQRTCSLVSLVVALSLTPVRVVMAQSPAPAAVAPATSAKDTLPSRIKVGDTLDIRVFGEDGLARVLLVGPDGTITYPFLGDVKVAGMTTSELSKRIYKKLSERLVDPQVTVTLTSGQSTDFASILGPVKSPGNYLIKPDWHLLDLIAAAGGLSTLHPEWTSATLIRHRSTQPTPINLQQLLSVADPASNLPLEPGDILLVQTLTEEQTQIQVLGEVTKPGGITVPIDGSIATALAAAGGLTPKASVTHAKVLRGKDSIPVDLRNYLRGELPANGIHLQPGDTLFVPENNLKFAVLGAVASPGVISYPEDTKLNAFSAITMAGGQTATADLKNARLLRSTDGNVSSVVKIDLSTTLKGDFSQMPPVLPGDVIWIPSKQPRSGSSLRDALLILPVVSLFRR